MDLRYIPAGNSRVSYHQNPIFMITKSRASSLVAVVVLGGFAASAHAQSPVGVRASGMAGAFVAVADDASAVYWNPAGLATGALVSFIAVFSGDEPGTPEAQAVPGDRDAARMVAFSLPPIGLAYYRTGTYGNGADTSAVTGPDSREEVRRRVYGLTTNTIGVSLLQSLSDTVVVGVTPKLVKGRGIGDTASVFDVDAGVMVAMRRLRLGMVARHLTTPTFAAGPGGAEVELPREVRVGAAWGATWPGHTPLVVAVDGDLTSRPAPTGERRDVAAGVETWWFERRLGLRGGVRGSTIGGARAAVAAGLSAGLTASLQIDAQVTRGHADERGWSVGLRAGF